MSFTIYSQNSLIGKITDSDKKTPVLSASVYIPKLDLETKTDDNGNFSFNTISNGFFKLIIYKSGYKTKSQIINLNNEKNEIKISLNPSIIEMDEVIVSTPFHKLQSENIMKVEKIKILDYKKNGSLSISDGLTDIPGVQNISTGLSIGKPVIRGLSSNRVLVYAQGIRLENQQFGEEHGIGINDSGIEMVEVIKGPASLLYGSDAIGGVIYINPEKFLASNSSNFNFENRFFSNTSGYNTSLSRKWSSNKFKYILRISKNSHADYKTKKYKVTNTRFEDIDYKGGLKYQEKNFQTELRLNINDSKIGIPSSFSTQSNNRVPMFPYQSIINQIYSVKSTLFFNKSSLEFMLGYNQNDRKEFKEDHYHEDEEHEEGPSLNMKLKTITYDAKYNLPISNKLELIIGSQGMNQNNINYGEEKLVPNAQTKDFAVYANSDIHLENFDLQLGLRTDLRQINIAKSNSLKYNSFNGAFGIRTNLMDNVIIRMNFASGFRSPNLAELASEGMHHGTNRYEIGDINLKKEHNFQTDISFQYLSDHLKIDLNGFYNNVKDYILLSPTNKIIKNLDVFEYKQNNAKLYGGEFLIHYHPHPLDLLHLKTSFETVIGRLEDNSSLPLIPAKSIKQLIRINFKKNRESYMFFKIKSTFDQNNVSQYEVKSKRYTLISCGLGSQFNFLNNPVKYNIAITNLTNKLYIDHLSRLKSEGIYNMGRNITLGINYNF
jgi:iron complex outermembrane receptor protein